jgi:CheY-like chemotaxis protein
MVKISAKFTPGDMIYIADKLQNSEVPFIVYCPDDSWDNLTMPMQENDRKINYIDSSIWLRYATRATLENVKMEIYDYHKRGLYHNPKAKESRELNARLVKSSYLVDYDNKGHNNYVSPFLFHSESKMKTAADEIINRLNGKRWRFLLVDDEAIIDPEKESDMSKRENNSRCKIIKDVLSVNCKFECKCKCSQSHNCPDKVKSHTGKGNICIEMVCVKSVDEAIAKLASPEEYDIVLMDYLLGDNKDTTGREYSDEILKRIKAVFETATEDTQIEKGTQIEWIKAYVDYENLQSTLQNEMDAKIKKETIRSKILEHIKGVNGRFWFFFISAYNVAVHERLLTEQMLHNTEYWHIEEGASPITTPHLFRYLLFSLMKRQIEAIIRLEVHNRDLENDDITLIGLLKYIFENKETVRRRATEHFANITKMRIKYDKLKYDIELHPHISGINRKKLRPEQDHFASIEQSPLAKSLFPDLEFYDNAFWEHTMHLVYLTAFGTIRQWHDMWEEYLLIKKQLDEAYDKAYKDRNPKPTKVSASIEAYIKSLQQQSAGSN